MAEIVAVAVFLLAARWIAMWIKRERAKPDLLPPAATQLAAWSLAQGLRPRLRGGWLGDYRDRLVLVTWSGTTGIEVALRFWPELDLNLNVSGEQLNSGKPIHHGVESERVARLFSGGVQQERALKWQRELARASTAMLLSDNQLLLRFAENTSEKELTRSLNKAAALVAHIELQCMTVPPRQALQEQLWAWDAVARERDLSLRTTPLALAGTLSGYKTMGSTVRESLEMLDVMVWSDFALVGSVTLTALSEHHNTNQETPYQQAIARQVGDRAWRAMLDLINQQGGSLTLSNRHLWLRIHTLPEPHAIVLLMHEVAELARDIDTGLHGGADAAGYRSSLALRRQRAR